MNWVKKWTIESDKSGKRYTVALSDAGVFGCSCLAWTRRRIECSHIKKLKRIDPAGIERVVKKFDIPIMMDVMTRDWVRLESAPMPGTVDPDEEFIDSAKESPAPSLMALINKNAEWRI